MTAMIEQRVTQEQEDELLAMEAILGLEQFARVKRKNKTAKTRLVRMTLKVLFVLMSFDFLNYVDVLVRRVGKRV